MIKHSGLTQPDMLGFAAVSVRLSVCTFVCFCMRYSCKTVYVHAWRLDVQYASWMYSNIVNDFKLAISYCHCEQNAVLIINTIPQDLLEGKGEAPTSLIGAMIF